MSQTYDVIDYYFPFNTILSTVWWCPCYVTAVYVNNWSWHVHGSHSVCLLKPGVTGAISRAQPESSPAATVTSKFSRAGTHAVISLTVSPTDVVGMRSRCYPWPCGDRRAAVAINSAGNHDEVFTPPLVSSVEAQIRGIISPFLKIGSARWKYSPLWPCSLNLASQFHSRQLGRRFPLSYHQQAKILRAPWSARLRSASVCFNHVSAPIYTSDAHRPHPSCLVTPNHPEHMNLCSVLPTTVVRPS
jgi:hypothetical protein